jgi:hypothetical protein
MNKQKIMLIGGCIFIATLSMLIIKGFACVFNKAVITILQ